MSEHALLKQEAGERIANDICAAIHSGILKPGDKLQGETELARIYKGSIYNVRKALSRLKKAHVVRSIPKVGVFISETTDSATPETEIRKGVNTVVSLEQQEITDSRIHFLTAFNPVLSGCWNFAAESFHERLPFASAVIDFGNVPDTANPPDIWECPSPFHKYQYDDIDAFDFSGFQDASIALLSPKVVQFMNSVDLLFYNPELLNRLGIPEPSWRTFDEQMEYLDGAVSELQHSDLMIPGSIQQPLMRLDQYFYKVFADIRRSHFFRMEQFIEKYEDPFRKVTDFWKKFQICHPKQAEKNLSHFLSGETPFFFGNSFYYGQAKQYFQFACHPMLNVENRLQTLASGLLLSAATEFPVESMRFLKHLQSSPVQRCFAEKGFLPLRKTDFDSLPFSRGEALFQTAPEVSFFFHSPEEQYIGMNIVNVELWDCILFEKEIQEALRNSLNFSKLYLKMKLDKTVKAKHESQAEIYS